MATVKRKPGRPKVKDKVKCFFVYLSNSDKIKIVKKYKSLTNALKLEALPKCG